MRTVFALVVGIGAVLAHNAPATAQSADDLSVVVEPAAMRLVLGENADISVSVSNHADAPTSALIVHLDITDPLQSTSVDPEDWTSTLSKPVGVLGPGDTAVVTWNVQPISPGTFWLYVVALSPHTEIVSASTVTRVDVDDERSLNPDGILPVAIAVPGIVGALFLAQLTSTRRGRRR